MQKSIVLLFLFLLPLYTYSFDIVEVANSLRQWTGIAVSPQGRIFVNYPRWSEDVPVSVAELLKDGTVRSYPDNQKNSWTKGSLASEGFVCVQSVVADEKGFLWILDPANPQFQGIQKGGPKLMQIDLSSDQVVRVYFFDESIAPLHSYLNDLRLDHENSVAYISESGMGAIIVLDLKTGKSRRVLANHPSTKSENVVLTIEGKEWRISGNAPQVHCDGIALTPDKNYIYYQALTGRSMYRIATSFLRDETLSEKELEGKVEFVAETGAADGLIFDKHGNLYISSLEKNAIYILTPENILKNVVSDSRICWPDSFAIDQEGSVYFTTAQIHLGGNIKAPYRIFKIVK